MEQLKHVLRTLEVSGCVWMVHRVLVDCQHATVHLNPDLLQPCSNFCSVLGRGTIRQDALDIITQHTPTNIHRTVRQRTVANTSQQCRKLNTKRFRRHAGDSTE